MIIVLLVLISSFTLAQQWNSIITTNISVSGAQYAEMFSNSFGNNVILQNTNGSITYYVMNSSTGQAGSAITVESSGASLANICGDAFKTYVIYKKDDVIKCKYTTNAGTNWSTISDLNLTPVTLDAVFNEDILHITYEFSNIAYYYQYDGSDWVNSQEVSISETGTNPIIKALPSQNKIYVVYNNCDNAKSREYNVSGNTWGDIETLYSSLSSSFVAGFGVDANYIYLYYSRFEYSPIPGWHYKFYTSIIDKSDYTTVSTIWETHNDTWYVPTTTTTDNIVHSAWKWYGFLGEELFEGYENSGYSEYSIDPGLIHEYFNNGSPDVENIDVDSYGENNYSNIDISSVSNDLYTIWKITSSNYLYYRQYDAAPLVPLNFAGTTHSVGWNAYPKITWSAINEPDVRGNANGIKIQRSINGGSFSNLTSISGTSTEYIDYSISYAGSGPHNVRYKIKSIDIEDNSSDWTSTVQIDYGWAWKSGSDNDETFVVTEYNLNQNYPNPFNPTTTIQYDVKEKGFVQLKVYDILGNEVAVLVNEVKESGRYNINFSASELPSGVYIYSLRVNDFVQNKKMTVLK